MSLVLTECNPRILHMGGMWYAVCGASRSSYGWYAVPGAWQVDMLKVSPVLTKLVKDGQLKIVGGVYDLATGEVKEVA